MRGVIALFCFALGAVVALLAFAQPDWVSLDAHRALALALCFGLAGAFVDSLPAGG